MNVASEIPASSVDTGFSAGRLYAKASNTTSTLYLKCPRKAPTCCPLWWTPSAGTSPWLESALPPASTATSRSRPLCLLPAPPPDTSPRPDKSPPQVSPVPPALTDLSCPGHPSFSFSIPDTELHFSPACVPPSTPLANPKQEEEAGGRKCCLWPRRHRALRLSAPPGSTDSGQLPSCLSGMPPRARCPPGAAAAGVGGYVPLN